MISIKININSCEQCPAFNGWETYCDDMESVNINNPGREIHDARCIPVWCPRGVK